jgi:hypothetical protein
MAKMLDDLETFFKAHQYTMAALGVAATFSAVVVSLVVALISLRSNRTRIRASVSVSRILHSTLEGQPTPTYATVHVHNLGILPVNIPFGFFQWKLPFVRERWTVNPWDYSQGDDWVAQKRYPVAINARDSETFFLASMETFRREMRGIFNGASFFRRWHFRFLKARVVADNGRIFDATVARSIRKELSTLLNEGTQTRSG